MNNLQIGLGALSGICWSLAYILIIRRGFLDKIYGMPLIALGANISWEFIFSFIHPHNILQRTVNITWFLLDVIILLQFFKYGRKQFKSLNENNFYLMTFTTLVMSFLLVLFITYEFQDWSGVYTAFGQNLMMSILFIVMLFQRNNLQGQSIYIALLKMIGTASASLSFYLFFENAYGIYLLPFLYLSILFFDLYYIILLKNKAKELKINLWKML